MLSVTRVLFASLLLAGSITASAHGQLAVYGMGSGGFLGSTVNSSGFSSWGGTVGVYDDFSRFGPVKFGVDGRYFHDVSSNDNAYGNVLQGGLVGPRLALKLPLIPIMPYVQGEIGDIRTNYGTQSNRVNNFGYQIQGGVDWTFFPHLDLRAEYGGGEIKTYGSGSHQSVQEVGLGLVVRFF